VFGHLSVSELSCCYVERSAEKLPDHIVRSRNGVALDPNPAHSPVSANDAKFFIEAPGVYRVFESRQHTNPVGGMNQVLVRRGVPFDAFERPAGELLIGAIDRDYLLGRSVEEPKHLLAVIYQLEIAEIQKWYGIEPDEITKERPLFRPPKTHLLTLPEESAESAASPEAIQQLKKTNLLSQLVDIWGDVPVPLLRRLDLRRSLYGYIGMEDRTMWPLLPPGTFVQIDAKQTRVQKGPFGRGSMQSQFARPIYFLDIRTGYACGWCQIEDGILTLIPHPDSGEPTRTFRHPSEVEVVGRVTGIAMRIGEEPQTLIEAALHRKSPPKK
jgi:hypothetical protein